MTQRELNRYVVEVPRGASIDEAIARHRDNTGHGGMICLRLASGTEADRGASREQLPCEA